MNFKSLSVLSVSCAFNWNKSNIKIRALENIVENLNIGIPAKKCGIS